MVGGKVINVLQLDDCTWVQCQEECEHAPDTCAIRTERNTDIKVGDSLWWQAQNAYWTPRPYDGREDVKLLRIGYSHRNIPYEAMKAIG